MDSFALFLRNTSGRQLPLSERLPVWQAKRFGLEGPEVPATRQRAWEKGSETTDARMRARARVAVAVTNAHALKRCINLCLFLQCVIYIIWQYAA